jgi:hypothetical protein
MPAWRLRLEVNSYCIRSLCIYLRNCIEEGICDDFITAAEEVESERLNKLSAEELSLQGGPKHWFEERGLIFGCRCACARCARCARFLPGRLPRFGSSLLCCPPLQETIVVAST